MRFRRIMLLIVAFIILIAFKTYAPKVSQVINEEPKNVTNEIDDNIINETPDIDKVETVFAYAPLSDEVIEKITGMSYIENDNIRVEELVYVQVTHWGFDDKEYVGKIILNKKVADDVVEIFKELYEAKFPIEKIRIIDEYDANDELSMLDNNSSAFCYREIAGSKGKLSKHSYGIAIDINPIQNPYVKNDIVLPESGKEYLDRDNVRKGMIIEGDACYNAFVDRGWTWGGEWNSLKDYQHFEFNLTNP